MAPPAVTAVAVSAVSLSPSSAAPGTQVTVTGTGFPTFGGNQIKVAIGQIVLATVPYQPPGFTARFAVPRVAPGFYTVTACVAAAGTCASAPGTSAQARLRVLPPLPPSPPPSPAGPGDLRLDLDPTCCDPPPSGTPLDLTGHGSPTPGPKIQNPGPGPDFPDLYIWGVEVTQNIQDIHSTMPLVAARKTWIRVHPRANTGNWGPIDGAILVKHGGEQEILYPVNGPIFTGLGVDRADADSALNFPLEPKWYAEGKLDISALVWAYGPSTLDEKEPNPENNFTKITVNFKAGRQPNLRIVPMDDGAGPGPSPTLAWTVFSSLVVSNSIVRNHPIADTNLKIYPIPLGPPTGNGGVSAGNPGAWDLTTSAGRDQPLQRLFWYHQLLGIPDEDRLAGIFDDSIPGGGYSGWAKKQYKSFWAKPSGTTPAHEAGHATGLGHVDCAGTEEQGGGLDKTHPNARPHCSLAPTSTAGYFGFTVFDTPFTIYSNDPAHPHAAFPLMSYKSPKWNDAYHWCKMLTYYDVPCSPEGIGVPGLPIPSPHDLDVNCDNTVTGPGGIELKVCFGDSHVVPAKPQNWLLVTGVLNQGGAVITKAALVDKLAPALAALAEPAGGGPNAIVVTDAAGAILAKVQVGGAASGELHGDGGSATDSGEFAKVIPVAGDVAGIKLITAGKVMATRQLSAHAPAVADLTAAQGAEGIRIAWNVSDADHDPVTSCVLWSADGVEWLPVALDTTATSIVVGAGVQLPGGPAVRIKVIANDGVRETELVGTPFAVSAKPPVVAIGDLPDGSRIPRYHVGDLTALGYDPEEGQLPGAALSWRSNLDGDLGTGQRLSLRRLSAGEHTLTATATDSTGATGTGTIHLIVIDTGAAAPRYQGADPDAERRLLAGAAVPGQSPWLWIVWGGVVVLGIMAGVLLWRRITLRRPPSRPVPPESAPRA
jgi:hypothetical protein